MSSATRTWYICKYCLRAFTNNDEMVNHKRSQHPDKCRGKLLKFKTEQVSDQEMQVEPQPMSLSNKRGKHRQSSGNGEELDTPKPKKSTKVIAKTESSKRLSSARQLNFDDVETPGSSSSEGRGESESRRPSAANSSRTGENRTSVSKRGKITRQSHRKSSSGRNSELESEDYSGDEVDEVNLAKQNKAGKFNSKRTSRLSNTVTNRKNSSHSNSNKKVISRRIGRTHSESSSRILSKKSGRAMVTPRRQSEGGKMKSAKKDTLTLKEVYCRLSVVAKLRKSNGYNFGCRYCGAKFAEKDELSRHERNEEKLFILESESNAAVVFSGKSNGKSEANSVRRQKSASIENLTRRNSGITVKSNCKSHQCEDCDEHFTTAYFLGKHKKDVHTNLVEDSESDSGIRRFKDQKKNKKSSHGQQKQQNKAEPDTNLEDASIRDVARNIKNKEKTPSKKKARFECDICKVQFTSSYFLTKHLNTVHRNILEESDSETEDTLIPDFEHQTKNKTNVNGKKRQTAQKVNNYSINQEGAHKCRFCPVSFDRLDILMYHVDQIHRKGH